MKEWSNKSNIKDKINNKYNIKDKLNIKDKSNIKDKLNINDKVNIKDNKTFIIHNLSYKETEETIKEHFEKYGNIESVKLNYTKDKKFIGKAILTFKNTVKINNEIKIGHKILRIEKMKNKIINNKRIFISRINKTMKIIELRNILKKNNVKPKDIRIRYDSESKKNNGYCHLTYNTPEEATLFEKTWENFKNEIGKQAFYEYAEEKIKKV